MPLLALPFRTLRYGSFQRSFQWAHLLAENFGHALKAFYFNLGLAEGLTTRPPAQNTKKIVGDVRDENTSVHHIKKNDNAEEGPELSGKRYSEV